MRRKEAIEDTISSSELNRRRSSFFVLNLKKAWNIAHANSWWLCSHQEGAQHCEKNPERVWRESRHGFWLGFQVGLWRRRNGEILIGAVRSYHCQTLAASCWRLKTIDGRQGRGRNVCFVKGSENGQHINYQPVWRGLTNFWAVL